MMRIIEPIEIELDRPRKLLLTLEALKRAQIELNRERQTDPPKPIFRIMSEEMERGLDIGMDFCQIIIWAAMLYDDPAITIDHVGRIMPWNITLGLINQLINGTYAKIDQSEEIPDSEKKKRLNGIASSGDSAE